MFVSICLQSARPTTSFCFNEGASVYSIALDSDILMEFLFTHSTYRDPQFNRAWRFSIPRSDVKTPWYIYIYTGRPTAQLSTWRRQNLAFKCIPHRTSNVHSVWSYYVVQKLLPVYYGNNESGKLSGSRWEHRERPGAGNTNQRRPLLGASPWVSTVDASPW